MAQADTVVDSYPDIVAEPNAKLERTTRRQIDKAWGQIKSIELTGKNKRSGISHFEIKLSDGTTARVRVKRDKSGRATVTPE